MHPMTTVENVLIFNAIYFLAHLCQSSVVREVRQIHRSSVRKILDFVHIGLSALSTHTYTGTDFHHI